MAYQRILGCRRASGMLYLGLMLAACADTFRLGCTTAPTARLTQSRAVAAPPGSTLLSAKDLAKYGQTGWVGDALMHVAPVLFNPSGRTIVVSIDGAPPTDRQILFTIPASTIAEIR